MNRTKSGWRIVLAFSLFGLCSPSLAQVIFDAPPDPGSVYTGPLRVLKFDKNDNFEGIPDVDGVGWNWHAVINNTLAERFAVGGACVGPASRHVVVQFTVTSERRIANVRCIEKSSDSLFNSLAMGVVNSLDRQKLLEFPDGYRIDKLEVKTIINATTPEEAILRRACIPEATIKNMTLHSGSGDKIVTSNGVDSREQILPLMRPGDVQIVAVLAIYHGRVTGLNPRGNDNDYGLIPPLESLSVNETDYLWGSNANQSQPSGGRTYKLTDSLGREFFIDLAMRDNRIDKYRVRGDFFKPQWFTIESNNLSRTE